MTRLPRLLDANLREVRRLHPYAELINEKIVPLSYATLDISKDESVPNRSFIELFNPYGSAGVYRARLPKEDCVNNTISLQLEHSVAEIGDYLITDAINEELSVANAFRKAFSYYRGNRWKLGSINVGNIVLLNVDYENVLETLIGILDQVPQYYMTFDFSTIPWTLNVAQKTTIVTAEGRITRNITSAIVNRDDKDLCTRAYVRGLPKPVGREDDENAVGYIDADTIGIYGLVEREVSSGSDLTEEQARRVAENYLSTHKYPKLSIEIDGIDLASITGETLDKFEIGKRFRLAVPDNGIVLDDVISAVSWSDVYNNPEVVRIVVGQEQDASIEFYKEQASASKASKKGSKAQAKKNDAYDLNLERTDEFGSIIHQAGMHLDADGFLVYSRDNVNNIGSMFDVRDNMIKAEVTNRQNADDVLNGKLTVEADRITAEVTRASTKEGELAGRITVASNKITAEVTRATQKEGELAGRITVEANKINAEVTRATSAEGTLSGRITVEANRITQEVTRATQAEGDLSGRITTTATEINAEVTRAKAAENSLSGRITVNSNKVAVVVEEKNGQNVLKTASIVTAINDSGSSILLDADKIRLTGQTTINDVMTVQSNGAVAMQRNLVVGGAIYTSYTPSGSDVPISVDLRNAIVSASVSGNTLTLTSARGSTTTFSKAVSSWSVGGGNGRINVTANPQNQTKSVKVSISGLASITSNGTYTYEVMYENADGDDVETGASADITVNIPTPAIDIPTNQIYTSDRATGTELTKFKTAYEKAKSDGDYVMFRVDCGGTSKWYYMEP